MANLFTGAPNSKLTTTKKTDCHSMLELIAQGKSVDSRWRRQLPEQAIEIGRATHSYRVPWDGQVSRRHAILKLESTGVRVEKVATAANPIFFNGNEVESFLLSPGEHFVIGQTTFSLTADKAFVTMDAPNPISQRTFSPELLKQVPYRNADRRIEILNQLPEIISSAGDVEELLIRIVNTLFAGVPTSSTIGIVELQDSDASADSPDSIRVIQWDRRGLDGGDFQPSERLIRQSIELNETTLHIWNQKRRAQTQYTLDYQNDWAFACPIISQASPSWAIYVAGSNHSGDSTIDAGAGESDVQDDVKFCELVGTTLKNLLLVKQLERQQSSLRSFFSPIVMDAIAGCDPEEVLAPRKCDVSVLFCDLRGFSRTSEAMADNLLELLARVSDSLGIMTHKILQTGGVIGDFHGDSAMGFWGWPIEPTKNFENGLAAITAAVEIQAAVAEQLRKTPSLQNFQIGLGIASGEAVAGKIGTRDQVKVTAFGPVVNLASRLEGMSKYFGSCILADGETVERYNSAIEISGEQTPARPHPSLRRLGRFQPFGLAGAFDVYQIAGQAIASGQTLGYEKALQSFESGDWESAKEALASLSTEDAAVGFLSNYIVDKVRPTSGFDGAIQMVAK